MKKKEKKEWLISNRGITLVALIITTLLLLVIAGIITKVVIDQGILQNAKFGSDRYVEKAEKTEITIGYQRYLQEQDWNASAEKPTIIDPTAKKSSDDTTIEDGKGEDTSVDTAKDGYATVDIVSEKGWKIEFDDTTHNKYTLTLDGKITKGEEFPEEDNTEDEIDDDAGEVWKDNGDGTFSKGEMTVAIGDYVAYDATKDAKGNPVATTGYTSYSLNNASESKNDGRTSGYTNDQVFQLGSYKGGWRIMGVDSEGHIQLVAVNSINPDSGGLSSDSGQYCLEGQKGFASAIGELNAICAIYGQGKGALRARSITIDDINKITGYNPDQTGTGGVCDAGNIHAYGNEVTYYWQGTKYPYYSGSNGKTGTLGYSHDNSFEYWDGSAWQSVARSTSASSSKKEKIVTLKCTAYWYYPTTLKNSNSGSTIGISTSSTAYKTFFGRHYWLASDTILTGADHADFGLKVVEGSDAGTVYITGSSSSPRDTPSLGICPVITLSKKFNLAKRNGIWQIVDSTQ